MTPACPGTSRRDHLRHDDGRARAIRAASRTGRLVIASVPANHVYVRHLAPEDGRARCGCPTPTPTGPTGRRRAALVAAGHARPDVGRRPTTSTSSTCTSASTPAPRAARRAGRRAATPRQAASSSPCTTCATRTTRTASLHDRQLDVLVPAADALITLTPGAAAEIAPALGPRGDGAAAPARRRPATMRGVAATPAPRRATGAVPGRAAREEPARQHGPAAPSCPTWWTRSATLPGAVLQVNGHRDVLDDGRRAARRRRWPTACGGRAAAGDLELHVHDFLADDDLWAYLASPRRLGAALPLRHPLRLAGGVPRPRHDGGRPDLRLLRRPGPGADLPPRRATASTPLAGRRGARGVRGRARARPPSVRTSGAASAREVAAAHDPLYRSLAGGELRAADLPRSPRAASRSREPFAGGLEAMTHSWPASWSRAGTRSRSSPRPGSDPPCR